ARCVVLFLVAYLGCCNLKGNARNRVHFDHCMKASEQAVRGRDHRSYLKILQTRGGTVIRGFAALNGGDIMKRACSSLVAVLVLRWALERVAAQDRTYNKPTFTIGSEKPPRLDWCMYWGAACGPPTADAFCHRRRFERASASQIDENIGRTRVMYADR